jgi:3-oxoacyl-[acyl-carrier protein] reductase
VTVALVSGSSRGIGKAIVERLASDGMQVTATGRSKEALALLQSERVDVFAGDLTAEADVKACVDAVLAKRGRLDVVVANLGSGSSMPGWDVPLEEFRRVFELNYFSAVLLCQYALPRMTDGGHIVLIGSIAGMEALGAPIAYASAKAAIVGYAKALSRAVAARKIAVNVVSPGNVLHEGGTWEKKMNDAPDATRAYIENEVPFQRFASPSEIADAVSFLVASRFITGANLVVDGGQTRKIA